MRVLVTGAAGYIGSVVTEQLISQGHAVLALDNLEQGHQAAVDSHAQFVRGDLMDAAWLKALFAEQPVDAVVHLAAEALVNVSMRDPGLFFRVNVGGGINLLDAMVAAGVRRMVFSSTAAVYGEPSHLPIQEDALQHPVNAYGESKLMFEQMLAWYRRAHGLNYVTLRYFNACGATEEHGEYHLPETHIIPLLFDVALGHREAFNLYGTDYATPDGSCIRDYIHVADIAQAHFLALEEIDRIGGRCFNMGNEEGYSNSEVVEMVRAVTGCKVPVIRTGRRPGDPACLVASSDRIRKELGWKPVFPGLRAMVETAWAWRQAHPRGYEG